MNPQAEEAELFDRAFDELREMRAKEAVSDWNRKHGVGTMVEFVLDGKDQHTKTRSPAYIAARGTPKVLVNEFVGGIALEWVRAVGS